MAVTRTLEQWLDHQERVHPQSIEMGLSRLREVLRRMHWRQPTTPIIMVAGTNGKGSVAAYCSSILAAADYAVGTFTSPHLQRYHERILVRGRPVSDAELIAVFERIESARLEPPGAEISLTFFEYNTLAALLIFEAAKLDAWVLEVGLGGRLDAVNVVDPSVSVVVSIGLDHQEYLGDTVQAIAAEKAGIFRDGRPAILGSREMPDNLTEIAVELGALPKRLGREFSFTRAADSWNYHGNRWGFGGLPFPTLAGDTQLGNAATAIAALEELDYRFTIVPDAVARGLRAVALPGRFQVEDPVGGPRWILDVAHNPAAAHVLSDNLRALPASAKTLAVCGVLADKDVEGIAAELNGRFDAWWVTSLGGERGQSAAQLAARVASVVTAPIVAVEGVAQACEAARATADELDRIVVFGSFHTVGPALDWLQSR